MLGPIIIYTLPAEINSRVGNLGLNAINEAYVPLSGLKMRGIESTGDAPEANVQ